MIHLERGARAKFLDPEGSVDLNVPHMAKWTRGFYGLQGWLWLYVDVMRWS